jgi:hypothetical protein
MGQHKDMDDVIAFAQEFIDREHDALQAELLEPDLHALERKVLALENLASFPGLASGIYRAVDDTLPTLAQAKKQLQTQALPRRLLKVERYSHARYGSLYAAYLTSTFTPTPTLTPALRLLIAHLSEDGWQIIARESACFLCGGAGTFEGRTCSQCQGRGWGNTGGERIELKEAPIETRTFEGEQT